MVRRIKNNTNLRKNEIKKRINNDWIATWQIKNRAPVQKSKEKNSVRNTEINNTDGFSDDWLTLKSNYCLLEIFTWRIMY